MDDFDGSHVRGGTAEDLPADWQTAGAAKGSANVVECFAAAVAMLVEWP